MSAAEYELNRHKPNVQQDTFSPTITVNAQIHQKLPIIT